VEAAQDRLRAINPNVEVVPFPVRLSADNALKILADFDVVADGTDNFAARYLVNDACVLLGKPNVYASVYRFEGQACVFDAKQGPCYRCLFPEPPAPGTVPSCEEGGILGVLPGLLGMIQAAETIKLVLGIGSTLVGRLLLLDALSMRFREIRLSKNPACEICGDAPTRTTLAEMESPCEPRTDIPSIAVEDLKSRLDCGRKLVLVDVREPHEVEISALPGSIKIPLRTLPESLNRLSTADEIVVYCKMGGRSAQAVQFLLQSGFRKVQNLEGGIDRWAQVVDPDLKVS
jgi:rhodanese-related sulfurtransferase